MSVGFYAGTQLIGTATSTPYAVLWPGLPAGQFPLTAVALDSLGAGTASSPVSITVAQSNPPPVVILLAPFPGEVFQNSAAIPLSASASETNGQVASMSFLANGALLATLPAAATNVFLWTNRRPGGRHDHGLGHRH